MTEQVLPAEPLTAASEDTSTHETRTPFATAGYRTWWAASFVAGTGVGIQAVTVPLFIRDRVSDDERPMA